MKILALELSSSRGSIAWLGDPDGPLNCEFANDRKHSGLFFENLQRFCDRCGRPDAIVVGLGPGSYAGTRIAIATAIGLQAAQGSDLFGLPSICGIATDAREYCVVGDARRQSFFFARIRQRQLAGKIGLCPEDELRQRLSEIPPEVPIYSSEPLPQFDRVIVRHPLAAVLAQLIRDRVGSPEEMPLQPIYLRAPHITMPKTALITP